MDLVEIIKTNPKARQIILNQNVADSARKYGITLAQAKQLHQLAAVIEMRETA